MITRYLNVIAVLALIGCAAQAYAIKYNTMRYAAEIVKVRHQIEGERDANVMLQAEWARLTRPSRVQELADRHLDLVPVTVDQFVKAADLPERGAKIDTIGRKLEALGLSEPTQTPRDDRVAAARSSTPTSSR